MQKRNLTHRDIAEAASRVAAEISNDFYFKKITIEPLKIYAVPRGGIPCAYLLSNSISYDFLIQLVEDVREADVIIDDIEDSGKTKRDLERINPRAKFYALFNSKDNQGYWLSFPWERTLSGDDKGIENELIRLSEYLKISIEEVKESLLID